MPVTYWTQKNEYGGYEKAHGNRQLESGEWVNTGQVPVHRLCAVAWFGFDAVAGSDVHHRVPIPWLNVESNLAPLPSEEQSLITSYVNRQGVPHSIIDAVTGEFGDE